MQEPWEVCPPKKRLQAYAQKRLQGKFNEWTYRHLKFCGKCIDYMARLSRVPSPDEIIQSTGFLGRFKAWIGRIFSRSRFRG